MGFVHIDHIGLVVQSIEQARQVLGEAVGLDLDEARSNWPDGSYFRDNQTVQLKFSEMRMLTEAVNAAGVDVDTIRIYNEAQVGNGCGT